MNTRETLTIKYDLKGQLISLLMEKQLLKPGEDVPRPPRQPG